MTIETVRIYEISRDKFHGVFQDEWSRPVAVIEWENELRLVQPYQVKFKEDE